MSELVGSSSNILSTALGHLNTTDAKGECAQHMCMNNEQIPRFKAEILSFEHNNQNVMFTVPTATLEINE